jgi:hydrogenase expression/formation protein HypC
MCLAVPGKIMEVVQASDDPVTGRVGVIDFQGTQIEASLAMVPEAAEGAWVLVHAGFALTILDEAEAKETFETLQAAFGDDIELPGAPQ